MKSEIEFSWVAQEALKGTSVLNAINTWPWSHIGCEDVIENPLFTPFRNETERMSSTNLFSATDAAATPQLRARFLADAIPAESHAAGANAFDVRANIANTRMDQDVREGGYMSNYDRWPEKDRDDNQAWKHSSFKQTAYFFTYKLFDYFVKGN